MAKIANILIGGTLAFGAAYLIYKAAQKTSEYTAFYNQLAINVKPKSIKLDGKILQPLKAKLIIKLDVEFINPTKTSISFQKPNVIIKYKDTELARSKVSTDIVTIQPQGTSRISDITFEIPLANSTTLSTLTDMIRTVGTGVFTTQGGNTATNISAIISALSNNVLTKLMPLLTVDLLTYIGDMPITYTQKLG